MKNDPEGRDKIYLASCIDDNYAMPFAVAIRSVIALLDKGRSIEWFVLNAGLSEENIQKISSSVRDERLKLRWLCSERACFKGIIPRAHISMAAYYKVLLFDLIPRTVKRVIYLDADLLVCRDIAELWDCSCGEPLLYAVQDQAIPFIDSRQAMDNFRLAAPFMESPIGIKQYSSFGINPRTKYFNSGVMVINLGMWRSKHIESLIVEFLQRNRRHNRCFDQDGFNAILWDQWEGLDPRWNQITHIFRYPSWERSPFDEKTFNEIKNDPFIVHFVSYDKPWHWGGRHPFKQKFFQYLEETQWKGWRSGYLSTVWKLFIFRMKSVLGLLIRIHGHVFSSCRNK